MFEHVEQVADTLAKAVGTKIVSVAKPVDTKVLAIAKPTVATFVAVNKLTGTTIVATIATTFMKCAVSCVYILNMGYTLSCKGVHMAEYSTPGFISACQL